MAPSVFVSYCTRSDKVAAFELLSRVEAQGIECWIAPRDVQGGTEWAAEIVSAITTARVMVLIFSASSNESPQVRNEVTIAIARGVHIVPFRVEDVVPSSALEYFLSSHHWLDAFPPPMEPHYARLCACLNNILASPTNTPLHHVPPPAPLPEPRPSPRPRVIIDAAKLRRLEYALAVHIGPFAKEVVDRAAAGASTVEALLREVGGKIESETERQKFINGCQWLRAG